MESTQKKNKLFSKGSIYLIAALIAGILLVVFSGGIDFMNQNADEVNDEDFELLEKRSEERIRALVIQLEGVNDASVVITLDELPSQKVRPAIRGVAIVCQGNESAELTLQIVRLVSTALGVTSEKIFVTFS